MAACGVEARGREVSWWLVVSKPGEGVVPRLHVVSMLGEGVVPRWYFVSVPAHQGEVKNSLPLARGRAGVGVS